HQLVGGLSATPKSIELVRAALAAEKNPEVAEAFVQALLGAGGNTPNGAASEFGALLTMARDPGTTPEAHRAILAPLAWIETRKSPKELASMARSETNPDVRRALDLLSAAESPPVSGWFVTRAPAGSAFAAAGLVPGDIIVRVATASLEG